MAFISEEHTRDYIASLVERSRKAQRYFEENYTDQHSIDEVVRSVAVSVRDNALELCQEAVAETGLGNIEGKMLKLVGIGLVEWTKMRGRQSVGYADCPDEPGVKFMFKPLGVIGAVMPSTNPLATIIGNSMMALKCRNSIIIAPHPASAHVSEKLCGMVRKGLAEIGAPEDLLITISSEESCVQATNELLKQCDVNIATGGKGMVKAVYSSGKPAFGVGQGNCQDIVCSDFTVDEYPGMVAGMIFNRTMDNGVPCTGDQTVHIPEENEDAFINEMQKQGAFLLTEKEDIDKLRECIFPGNQPRINRAVVGRVPYEIGKLAGIDVPEDAKVILLKNQAWGDQDVLCLEILCPVTRYTTYKTFEEAVDRAVATLYVEGAGHSSAIWTHDEDKVDYAATRIPVGRFHVNQPTGGGGSGIHGSITIGCGSWGGNSISEFLNWYHLYNKTKVTHIVPNLKHPDPSELDKWDIYTQI